MNPLKLRVDDRTMRTYVPAIQALALQQRQVSAAQRAARHARRTTYHALAVAPTANQDWTRRGLCGRDLAWRDGERRHHVPAYGPHTPTCADCLRLQTLSPDERAAEAATEKLVRAARFAKLAEKTNQKRAAKLEEIAREVALARDDAAIAWDACCEVDWDLHALSPANAEFLARTCATAITAHRQANPRSRGTRRWVCRERVEDSIDVKIVCRFCSCVLRDGQLGIDYTSTTDAHTVPCALLFLTESPYWVVDVDGRIESTGRKPEHAQGAA